MRWYYREEEVDEIPLGAVGFVYLIECSLNGKKYIGKKLFQFKRTKTKTVTLKDGTKKKKKIHTKVDSDWRTYFGSSDALLSDLESIGVEHFRREILHFCTSKASCSYIEAQEQFARNVLESDVYYNNQIMVRVHGNHIRNKALTVS